MDYEAFKKLVQRIEKCTTLQRVHDGYSSFFRKVNIDNSKFIFSLVWFKNALTIKYNEMNIHCEFPLKDIRITGTWPNHAKCNLQIKSENIHIIMPLVYYP